MSILSNLLMTNMVCRDLCHGMLKHQGLSNGASYSVALGKQSSAYIGAYAPIAAAMMNMQIPQSLIHDIDDVLTCNPDRELALAFYSDTRENFYNYVIDARPLRRMIIDYDGNIIHSAVDCEDYIWVGAVLSDDYLSLTIFNVTSDEDERRVPVLSTVKRNVDTQEIV